jgi:hypothetical protein
VPAAASESPSVTEQRGGELMVEPVQVVEGRDCARVVDHRREIGRVHRELVIERDRAVDPFIP